MSVLHMIFGAIIPFVASIVLLLYRLLMRLLLLLVSTCAFFVYAGCSLLAFSPFLWHSTACIESHRVCVDSFAVWIYFHIFAHFYFILCQPQMSKKINVYFTTIYIYFSDQKKAAYCIVRMPFFLILNWSQSI